MRATFAGESGRSTRAAQALVWLVFGWLATSRDEAAAAARVGGPERARRRRRRRPRPCSRRSSGRPAARRRSSRRSPRPRRGRRTCWSSTSACSASTAASRPRCGRCRRAPTRMTIEMTVGPNGALWLSGWDGVVVLAPDSGVRASARPRAARATNNRRSAPTTTCGR